MAGSLTPSAGVAANALRSRWDGRFIRRPNENRNITKYFTEPEGVDKIGDTLYMRILPVIATNSLSTTDTGLSLTYDNTAIDRVAALEEEAQTLTDKIADLDAERLAKLNEDIREIKGGRE